MGLSLRKAWPCEHRITLLFWMLLNDLGCLWGKVRFSQSLPESLAALHVSLGAGPGKGSEDVQAQGADGVCGLLARASPTGGRLSLMKEKPFSPHSRLLTSEL